MNRIAALIILAIATPAFAQQPLPTRQEWIDLQIVREAAQIAAVSAAKVEQERVCGGDISKLTDDEKSQHASLCGARK